jgi:hypothetical protein
VTESGPARIPLPEQQQVLLQHPLGRAPGAAAAAAAGGPETSGKRGRAGMATVDTAGPGGDQQAAQQGEPGLQMTDSEWAAAAPLSFGVALTRAAKLPLPSTPGGVSPPSCAVANPCCRAVQAHAASGQWQRPAAARAAQGPQLCRRRAMAATWGCWVNVHRRWGVPAASRRPQEPAASSHLAPWTCCPA